MKGYQYRIDKTAIEFDPVDLPPGVEDRKVDFDRADTLRRLATTHSGHGLSPDEMALALEIRRKINDAAAGKKRDVILIKEESVHLKDRLQFMRWVLVHAEIDEFCKSVKDPKEVPAEIVAKKKASAEV